MRGRFFTPVLTVSVFSGALALAEQMSAPSRYLPWQLAGVCCILVSLWGVMLGNHEPALNRKELIVVNERKFYWPGYSLSHYLEHGSVRCAFMDSRGIDALRAYAEKCGPITLHLSNPGTIGYLVGPGVSIVDTQGLTDSYVAKLPRKFLALPDPRPGHPAKLVPRSYLISRGDVSLVPNWGQRIVEGDCTLTGDVKNLDQSEDQLVPP
jgi:hypothetical protein